jgi:hypothetical protein
VSQIRPPLKKGGGAVFLIVNFKHSSYERKRIYFLLLYNYSVTSKLNVYAEHIQREA